MTQFFTSTRQEAELFDAFFDSGMEESVSPFLTPSSRKWGKNIQFKCSLIAGVLLLLSYLCLLFLPSYPPLSQLTLLMTYFFAGVPALIAAVDDLLQLEINIDVLMVLAAFLSIFIGSGHEGALLLVLFSFSNGLEKIVSGKAKEAIYTLKNLSPSKAHVLQSDGTLLERSIKDITPGTKILVKAGQVVPLDGQVIEGISSINLVHLTGENMPVTCQVGDTIQAGASNLDGVLVIQVTHRSGDSTIARIIDMIHNAAEAKPALQRWFDRITNRYATGVIICAFLVALTFPFLLSIPFFGSEGSIYRALAFLIAASPCALIIAIPIAYLSAMSACARNGILLKGGIVLDALKRCKILALDKTGTLTEGSLQCVSFDSKSSVALSIAYALEQNIEHPIAKAICSYAANLQVIPAQLKDFHTKPGHGVFATWENQIVAIGNVQWLLPQLPNNEQQRLLPSIEEAKTRGESVAILQVGSDAYLFCLKDHLRKGVLQTLKNLKDTLGLQLVMLTGDHSISARRIAQEAGIQEVYANLKPEDKLLYIERFNQNKELAMVGDGINDAPALARATVGIAMGGMGTDTAVKAADIILLQDKIDRLDWLFLKARKTTRIVTENICLAAGAILVAVTPALLGFLPLWLAVLLHEGGTVIVGINALRLLKR